MSTLILLAALLAGATPPSADSASATALHVGLRRTLQLERPTVTAAYAVDDTLVEASVADGRVRIYGVRPGTTQVALVSAQGVETLPVTVDRPPSRVFASAPGNARGQSSVQAGFDSQTGRLTAGLDAVSHSAGRTVRFRVASVTGTASGAGEERGTALPSVALSVEAGRRALVLGDERADASPLTRSSPPLRGLHWSSDRLLVHAGWNSATLYEDLFLPAQRESTAGASLRFRRGGATLMPSLYVFPGDSPYGGTRGALGSLLFGFRRAGGGLEGEAEVGYGGRAVGAAEVSFRGAAVQGRVTARHQPEGTASLGLGRPHGSFLAGDGTARISRRLTTAASFSIDRNESSAFAHRSEAWSGELRFAPGRRIRLRAGARFGSFDPGGRASAARTLTVPIEGAWDGARSGAYALYRLQRRSVSSELRSGGRLGATIRLSRLQAAAYVDWQPAAVSLDTMLGAEPRLARALAELGLSAQTPDDLARLLRENAALVDLGYFDPASLRFDAVRRQAGLDVAWTPGPRQRLTARVLLDRSRTGEGSRTTRVATLGYSREVAGFEVSASVSIYARDGIAFARQPSFRVALRRGLSGLPRPGRRALGGYVFRDDVAEGRPGPAGAGVSGVEVRLDDGRFTRTDDRGQFRFEGVARGARRVELALPAGAYFTTPSAVLVSGSRGAAFGLAFTPARLAGLVRDEAGLGVPGVRLRLQAGEVSEAATTDSGGRFSFAMAEGEYDLALEPGSLPPGYSPPRAPTRSVSLRRDAPARVDMEVVAQHSVGGRVGNAAPAETRVCLSEEDRCTTPGPDGRYVFRGVKAGAHTVVATSGDRAASRAVLVAPHPGAVTGVDLDFP